MPTHRTGLLWAPRRTLADANSRAGWEPGRWCRERGREGRPATRPAVGLPLRFLAQRRTDMGRLLFLVLMTLSAAASASAQPASEAQCAAKYDAARAAGTTGTMSREDFVRVCAGSSATGSVGTTYSDPFQFCRAAGTVDSGGEGGIRDRRYSGPAFPVEIGKQIRENFYWR